MSNKANLRRFWAENAGRAKKQSQSSRLRGKPANPKSEARNPKQAQNPNARNATGDSLAGCAKQSQSATFGYIMGGFGSGQGAATAESGRCVDMGKGRFYAG
jgi:hypothetical protein